MATTVQPAPTAALDPDRVRDAAARDLPLPACGRTLDRWHGLTELGRTDLALAKVVEPHHDAHAICADLGHPPPQTGALWEVWAAEPPGTRMDATVHDGGWRLSGLKPFCSGAGLATHALVTADAAGESRLFAVDIAAARADGTVRLAPPAWAGPGMAAADTRTVRFDGVPATAVGAPGAYVERPGFWHGAIGVACCWAGGAYGVAATLQAAARRRTLDPHALAHLGAVAAALDRCRVALRVSAEEIDADGGAEPIDRARHRAESVRATVVAAAEEIVARVGHALGPAPLALHAEHARRVVDLQVFVRQHHAERDLAALGALARDGASW